MPWPVVGDSLFTVHADINDNSRRPKRLRVEIAESVFGSIKKTKFIHQALGIQRPTFTVSADEFVALKSRQLLAVHHCHANLQVMAWYAFVICGGWLTPQREPGSAICRIPSASGPSEVFAGWHVILRRSTTRW